MKTLEIILILLVAMCVALVAILLKVAKRNDTIIWQIKNNDIDNQ